MAPAPRTAAVSMHSFKKACVEATVPASVAHSSRPGPMATQTVGSRPCCSRTSAARAGSQSPCCSIGSSRRSNPQAHTRGARAASRSSVSGETQIHAFAPRGFMLVGLLLAAPVLRVARHVLAAAERVVQRGHLRVDVVVEVLVGDLRLRQDPLLRDLLALHDL